ncbi:MAG: patatin-like phospholipase family protein, partial [Pseudomonadota bacterium]
SIRVMMTAMLDVRLAHTRPDILIRPGSRRFQPLDFNRVPEILEAAAPARHEARQRLAEVLAA